MKETLDRLLSDCWYAPWNHEKGSHHLRPVPALPPIPSELSMRCNADDPTRVTIEGIGWSESGSLVAVHVLLDRVWGRLGWPNLYDYRSNRNDELVGSGWESSFYRRATPTLLALMQTWPRAARAQLLAVLLTHAEGNEKLQEELEKLAKSDLRVELLIAENDTQVEDLFEGKGSRSHTRLLSRSVELFQSRDSLSRYAMLIEAATFATSSADAASKLIIKRVQPALMDFDPFDELSLASLILRQSAACYALENGAAELALPHLEFLIAHGRDRSLNTYRRARAYFAIGESEKALSDLLTFERDIARMAEHTDDKTWTEAFLWAKADAMAGGVLGLAQRRDGVAVCSMEARKDKPPKVPKEARRRFYEHARRDLLEPALIALSALRVGPTGIVIAYFEQSALRFGQVEAVKQQLSNSAPS